VVGVAHVVEEAHGHCAVDRPDHVFPTPARLSEVAVAVYRLATWPPDGVGAHLPLPFPQNASYIHHGSFGIVGLDEVYHPRSADEGLNTAGL
jgi:hypothetical protein